MSVTRKKKAAKAASKPIAAKPEPSPALKAQLKASIEKHGFITAKANGWLRACEQQMLTDLSGEIEKAMRPVSDFFLSDFKGITEALSHLRRSLANEQDRALVDFCIRSIERKVEVVTTAREDALSAVKIALHPEWHALPEATARGMI